MQTKMRTHSIFYCKFLFLITSLTVLSILFVISRISFWNTAPTHKKVRIIQFYLTFYYKDKTASNLFLFVLQDAIKVSVYYESLCPYSIRFITQQLYPNYYRFADNLNLDLVPYGKANVSKKKPKQFTLKLHG